MGFVFKFALVFVISVAGAYVFLNLIANDVIKSVLLALIFAYLYSKDDD